MIWVPLDIYVERDMNQYDTTTTTATILYVSVALFASYGDDAFFCPCLVMTCLFFNTYETVILTCILNWSKLFYHDTVCMTNVLPTFRQRKLRTVVSQWLQCLAFTSKLVLQGKDQFRTGLIISVILDINKLPCTRAQSHTCRLWHGVNTNTQQRE